MALARNSHRTLDAPGTLGPRYAVVNLDLRNFVSPLEPLGVYGHSPPKPTKPKPSELVGCKRIACPSKGARRAPRGNRRTRLLVLVAHM